MSFKCGQCSDVFDFQYKMIMHQYNHSVGESENKENLSSDQNHLPFECLRNNSLQYDEVPIFACITCNKTFKTEMRFIQHNDDPMAHHNDFECSLCTKKLSSKQCLQRHIRLHTGETQFHCEVCDKPFLTKHKLNAHKETHTPGFRCNICLEKFCSKSVLSTHRKSVNGSGLLLCTECPKKYLKEGHLKAHLRSHDANTVESQNKKFTCDDCGKAFRSNSNLLFHRHSHSKML